MLTYEQAGLKRLKPPRLRRLFFSNTFF